jgi:hypothetical protein
MISNYILMIVPIVLGAVCLLCLCNLFELYHEDRQTMRNRQIQRVVQLPPPYESQRVTQLPPPCDSLKNPPSYSEGCKQMSI